MPDGYVTIATYETPIAAELARVRLDGENIPAFIADSNTVAIQPFYGGAIGVRVQVPADMAEEAVAILRDEKFPIFMDPRHPIPDSEDPYDLVDDSDADKAECDDGCSGFQFDRQRFAFQVGAFVVVVYLLFRLLFE